MKQILLIRLIKLNEVQHDFSFVYETYFAKHFKRCSTLFKSYTATIYYIVETKVSVLT
jgi:hypothetical protein